MKQIDKSTLFTIIQESVGQIDPNLIQRSTYSSWLEKKLEVPLIKVITGFRRVGKSTLLKQLYSYLNTQQQIPKSNLFFVNYEHALLTNYQQSQDLYKLFAQFEQQADASQPVYLFLDEIQNVDNWQSFVRTLYEKNKQRYNIYVTGSNSSLLSSEFATALGGRTVELRVYPFSFNEYLFFHGLNLKSDWDYVEHKARVHQLLDNFLQNGGLPETAGFETELVQEYLQSTLKKVFLDDIISRFKINKPEILENAFYYVVTNTSSILSYRSIAQYLKGQAVKVSVSTLKRYLSHYEAAFTLQKIPRFSWKTKSVFKQQYKYYPVDHGLIYHLALNRQQTEARSLECLVFNKLARNNDKIYYGRDVQVNRELDFIVDSGEKSLTKVQVCLSLNDNNRKRELGNFVLADKYLSAGENLLITKDGQTQEIVYQGCKIKQIPLIKFLVD